MCFAHRPAGSTPLHFAQGDTLPFIGGNHWFSVGKPTPVTLAKQVAKGDLWVELRRSNAKHWGIISPSPTHRQIPALFPQKSIFTISANLYIKSSRSVKGRYGVALLSSSSPQIKRWAEVTQLAPVLFGASWYMTAHSAEQKICQSKFFVCVGTHIGGTQGEHPGTFSSIWGGPNRLPARHERIRCK